MDFKPCLLLFSIINESSGYFIVANMNFCVLYLVSPILDMINWFCWVGLLYFSC